MDLVNITIPLTSLFPSFNKCFYFISLLTPYLPQKLFPNRSALSLFSLLSFCDFSSFSSTSILFFSIFFSSSSYLPYHSSTFLFFRFFSFILSLCFGLFLLVIIPLLFRTFTGFLSLSHSPFLLPLRTPISLNLFLSFIFYSLSLYLKEYERK